MAGDDARLSALCREAFDAAKAAGVVATGIGMGSKRVRDGQWAAFTDAGGIVKDRNGFDLIAWARTRPEAVKALGEHAVTVQRVRRRRGR